LRLPGNVGVAAARAEQLVRGLADRPGSRGLEGMARFLLRSEAIASSRIEGLQVSPQQVALAELAEEENLQGRPFTANAKLVANNITTLRRAATELATAEAVTIEGVEDLRRRLLPDDKNQGLRTVQNWIGSGNYHPLDADFIPPPPDRVRALMEDACEYASGAVHAPLVQAALLHAQFETIHPFTDGNGRVGRALIHTVLTRRALTRAAVLPVSLVLLTRSQEYVKGLTAYRYNGPPGSDAAQAGVTYWVDLFLSCVEIAVDRAREFIDALEQLDDQWRLKLATHRQNVGLRALPRGNSAVARILDLLPEVPLMTSRTAERLLATSFNSARGALEELADAGILRRKQVDRGTTGYLANDVFELLTLTERTLASTQWDTNRSTPNRPVPARPQRN
jgi:Fic family protein